jgi:hypothetical protein
MTIRSYKEGNSVTVTARFTNSAGSAITPTSARYRVDCETTNEMIQDWQPLTPASSVSIAIAGALNRIIDQHHDYERKVVTVEANWDTPQVFTDAVKYDILNLQAIK